MDNDLYQENMLLRKEIRVLHQAAKLTADMVIQQFEQTELEKIRYQEAAVKLEGFKRTLDQIGDCIFMFDQHTCIFTYCNNIAVIHTGFSENELLSMGLADLGTGLSADKMAEILPPLVANPSESLLLQTVIVRKNGVEVPVELFIQYIPNTDDKGGFFSIVRNISKRLLEEKEKEQMQTKLLHAHKLESVGELAAGIAHEINTPIQYIGTNLSFMEEAFADLSQLLRHYQNLLLAVQQQGNTQSHADTIVEYTEAMDLPYLIEEIPQAIQQAKVGVERVRKLVLAMKEFSHPGAKEKEYSDINKIIRTTMQISRNEWKYCADIDLALAEDLPLIPCHPNEIGQVVLNLLVNAAHAIKERLEQQPNSPRGLIGMISTFSERTITLQCSDNGGGIPKAILNKIFDPFFTTKEVGRGTGQGLAIARNIIINKHGGDIEVTSEVGLGSTFTIHLPRGK